MFYLTIVNKILRHCHSWLARPYLNPKKIASIPQITIGLWQMQVCLISSSKGMLCVIMSWFYLLKDQNKISVSMLCKYDSWVPRSHVLVPKPFLFWISVNKYTIKTSNKMPHKAAFHQGVNCWLSYVIVIPWFAPVRGDNARASASGLSYVQVDKHGITILYHLHQCRPCTTRDISYLSW